LVGTTATLMPERDDRQFQALSPKAAVERDADDPSRQGRDCAVIVGSEVSAIIKRDVEGHGDM
jgi:hypothetical protein